MTKTSFNHYPPSLSDYALHDEHIDLWFFSLKNQKISTFFLDEEEKQRAERFHFAHHQRRFSVAHTITRVILARYLKTTPEEFFYIKNRQGKPNVYPNPHGLEFNLTHSGEWAMLAVGKNNAIGIDVEQFSPRSYLGLAKHAFSLQETNSLLACSLALRPLAFFNIWAQKEAFIKALGMGLAYSTPTFTVPLFKQRSVIMDHVFNQSWVLYSFMPLPMLSAALCCKPSIQSIHFYSISNDTLTSLL